MISSKVTVQCDWCQKRLSLSGVNMAMNHARRHGIRYRDVPDLWFETQTDTPILEMLEWRPKGSSWRLRVLVHQEGPMKGEIFGDFCSEACHKNQCRSVRERMVIKAQVDKQIQKDIENPKEMLKRLDPEGKLFQEIVVEPPKAYSKVVANGEEIGYVRGEIAFGVSEEAKREFQEEFDEIMALPMSDGRGNLVSGDLTKASPEMLARMAATREWHEKFDEKTKEGPFREKTTPKGKPFRDEAQIEAEAMEYVHRHVGPRRDRERTETEIEAQRDIDRAAAGVPPLKVHKAGKTDFYEAEDRYNEGRLEAETQLMGVGIGEAVPLEVQFELNKTPEGRKALHKHYEDEDQAIALRNAMAGRKPWWKRMFGA